MACGRRTRRASLEQPAQRVVPVPARERKRRRALVRRRVLARPCLDQFKSAPLVAVLAAEDQGSRASLVGGVNGRPSLEQFQSAPHMALCTGKFQRGETGVKGDMIDICPYLDEHEYAQWVIELYSCPQAGRLVGRDGTVIATYARVTILTPYPVPRHPPSMTTEKGVSIRAGTPGEACYIVPHDPTVFWGVKMTMTFMWLKKWGYTDLYLISHCASSIYTGHAIHLTLAFSEPIIRP